MTELPKNIVRFDAIRVEYGKSKMCNCIEPHYEIDYQNRLVYCIDCGAIVDPLEALVHIAKDTQRWEKYLEELLTARRQIANYHPRHVVLKELEKLYISSRRYELEPTCPHCQCVFCLEDLLHVGWVNKKFIKGGS